MDRSIGSFWAKVGLRDFRNSPWIVAGTGHWFTKIDDHIDYFMVLVDPDKITPLKSKTLSKKYLSKPADGGQ